MCCLFTSETTEMEDFKDTKSWTDATVVDIRQESATIKRLRLKIQDKDVTFKAGQWVDLLIPRVTPYTGYSMCTPPHVLETCGVLDLAVKHSDYPPTLWVHEQCKVGDKVQIRVGGDFYYAPELHSTRPDNLLLLAGGVGINPIFSILQHWDHLNNSNNNTNNNSKGGSVVFMYSAQSLAELVFKDDIDQIGRQNKNITIRMFSTQEKVDEIQSIYKNGRISEKDMREALASLDTSSVTVYICGPSSFIDNMDALCVKCGIDHGRIHYEKWWKH